MAVTKRLRYEVLRRDNFTCRYCGAKAPHVELTVDHVTPIALGGRDEPENLVVSCKPCNSGKTSTQPDAPLVADVNAEALRWATSVRSALGELAARDLTTFDQAVELQNYWYQHSWALSIERRRHRLDIADHELAPIYSEFTMPDDGLQTIERFLRYGLTADVIQLAMQRATYITPGIPREDAFRYFCGVCWRTIREAEDTVTRGPAQ